MTEGLAAMFAALTKPSTSGVTVVFVFERNPCRRVRSEELMARFVLGFSRFCFEFSGTANSLALMPAAMEEL